MMSSVGIAPSSMFSNSVMKSSLIADDGSVISGSGFAAMAISMALMNSLSVGLIPDGPGIGILILPVAVVVELAGSFFFFFFFLGAGLLC